MAKGALGFPEIDREKKGEEARSPAKVDQGTGREGVGVGGTGRSPSGNSTRPGYGAGVGFKLDDRILPDPRTGNSLRDSDSVTEPACRPRPECQAEYSSIYCQGPVVRFGMLPILVGLSGSNPGRGDGPGVMRPRRRRMQRVAA
eukprot:746197-Hanusia_phi.AAC.1